MYNTYLKYPGFTPKRQARGGTHLGLDRSHRVPQVGTSPRAQLSSDQVATADAKLVVLVATADAERVVATADAKNASPRRLTPNASVIGVH